MASGETIPRAATVRATQATEARTRLPIADHRESVVVHEIYASIQGESSWAGVPCTFVRLTGCNLRCHWCDTPAAFYGGQRRRIDDVVKDALSHETPLVEVTGGEPLLQRGTPLLLRRLADAGVTVLIETSGERPIEALDSRVIRILDLKAPGSGESARNRWSNIDHLRPRDEVKFVLASPEDLDWAAEVMARFTLAKRVAAVLLSPVHGVLDPQWLVSEVLRRRLPARVNLQLHKYIWGATAEGV